MRFMDRVLAETKVQGRFTEHDLHAKYASDAKSLAQAQQLLAHADSALIGANRSTRSRSNERYARFGDTRTSDNFGFIGLRL